MTRCLMTKVARLVALGVLLTVAQMTMTGVARADDPWIVISTTGTALPAHASTYGCSYFSDPSNGFWGYECHLLSTNETIYVEGYAGIPYKYVCPGYEAGTGYVRVLTSRYGLGYP